MEYLVGLALIFVMVSGLLGAIAKTILDAIFFSREDPASDRQSHQREDGGNVSPYTHPHEGNNSND